MGPYRRTRQKMKKIFFIGIREIGFCDVMGNPVGNMQFVFAQNEMGPSTFLTSTTN